MIPEVRDAADACEVAEDARAAEALVRFLVADFEMLQDGQRVGYIDTIIQRRATMHTLASFGGHWDDVQILPIGSDAALTSMIFHDEIAFTDNREIRIWGPSTLLWRKRAGRWQVVSADSDDYPSWSLDQSLISNSNRLRSSGKGWGR